MSNLKRPTLNQSIVPDIFGNFYWLKAELIQFCRAQGLSSLGSKIELTERIKKFLETGVKNNPPTQKINKIRDAQTPITLTTPVIHYKNDAVTRAFFVSQIGPHFRFNDYLRKLTNKENIKLGMTYGDLVDGWIRAEAHKKKSPEEIPRQFEYNRFIQEFFANEKGKSLKEAIKAWKVIKSKPGPNSYACYKKIAEI